MSSVANAKGHPVDVEAMRAYRLSRVRRELEETDIAAAIFFDPINIRYATDSSNMQVWTLHNPARYVMVMASGPVILWEFHGAKHLAKDLPLVTDVRVGTPWFHFAAGDQSHQKAKEFAAEIATEIQKFGGGNRRIAIDRVDTIGTLSLMAEGLIIEDGNNKGSN